MIASTQTNHPLTGNSVVVHRSTSLLELAISKLKSAGLRVTQPRRAIIDVLGKRMQPSTIEQLHEDVGTANCDLVTVYRCMAAFEAIGLVRRAFFHNGTALYEIAVGQPTRYHVVCKSTNSVQELDEETSYDLRRTIEAVQDKLRDRGYGEVGHIVEFFGVSPQGSRMSAPAVPPVP